MADLMITGTVEKTVSVRFSDLVRAAGDAWRAEGLLRVRGCTPLEDAICLGAEFTHDVRDYYVMRYALFGPDVSAFRASKSR